MIKIFQGFPMDIEGVMQSLMVRYQLLLVFVILLTLGCTSEKIIQTFSGSIGGGNYTYFSLHEKGEISLIVESLTGDVDVYVSQTVAKPTFIEYDLQSSTCGLDVVNIPKDFKRPVGIALYGHIYSPLSKYRLTAVLGYLGPEKSSLALIDSWSYSFTGGDQHYEEGEDDESSIKSILWTIFVGFLKILIEIIT